MPARLDPATGRGYRFVDRTGQRSGRLVFAKHLGVDRHKHQRWEAVCDCGAIVVTAQPSKTRSCGCLQRERSAQIQRARALPKDVKADRVKANQARQRARRRADPLVAMQARLSRLHRHALSRVGAIKTSPTFEQLGYTVAEFVQHIERQFLPGMGWHNLSEWQIDHIVPVSRAKTEADVIALNQLPNLRPMWAVENNAKKDKQTTLL